MLRAIIMWIYRMDLPMVLLLLAVFTIIFHTVHSQFIQYKFWKPAVILFLFLWAVIVLFLTIFQRTQDVSLYPIWQPFQSYVDALKDNGQPELLRSNFMNAVLFYPAGLLFASLLPLKRQPQLTLLIVFVLFAVFSYAIEFIQYRYQLGLAQTDDVIHNTLGACIGIIVFLIMQKIPMKPQK